jgi:hypothetical protein
LVRLKPNTGYQKDNVKIIGNNISIVDGNNRLLEEFEVDSAFGVK